MLLHAHSGFRYLVLLTGVIVIAYAAYGLATKSQYGKRMRILSGIFTGVVDLTALLGLLVVIFTDNFYPQLTGHIMMMVLAVVTAHVVHGVKLHSAPHRDSCCAGMSSGWYHGDRSPHHRLILRTDEEPTFSQGND